MRFVFLLSLLVGATACGRPAPPAPASPEAALASHRGRERVLVVVAPSAEDHRYVEQRKLWSGTEQGCAERDLVILPVLGDAGELATKLALEPRGFDVVLVGKDGHAASKSTEPVSAAAIFAQIDAMPMRRAEIRERSAR